MGLLQLLLQSSLMGVGTYVLGTLPLTLNASKHSQRTGNSSGLTWIANVLQPAAISTFSVGLLISTALAVIIPEGVGVVLRSLQSGKEGEREGEVHEHLEDDHDTEISAWIGVALVAGFVFM